MAPVQPAPLPQLDLSKCFTGEQQLISWDAAYVALCDPDAAAKSRALESFLHDPANKAALSTPWQPFPGPSSQEKAKFDSKTAPINVTPSPNGRYNIDEIKDDSIWLSKLVNISEDAALRLVILEWQARPSYQLLSGLTEEEALSVSDAAGLSSLGASTIIPNSAIVTAPSGLQDAQFNAVEQRRLRILEIYTTSRIAILRTSQLLRSWSEGPRLRRTYGQDYRVCSAGTSFDWLEQLGSDISLENDCLDRVIQAVEAKWDGLDTGFTWDVPEPVQEGAEILWMVAEITEIIHLLHIALIHADLLEDSFVAAKTVDRWFALMQKTGFFSTFSVPLTDQQHLVALLQLLTSLLSLAILNVNLVLQDLDSGRNTSWPASCYLLDGSLLERITITFGEAKSLGPSPATPPAFAWAIIIWRLTLYASDLEQMREQQIQGSSDGPELPPSALENAVLALSNLNWDLFEKRMPFEDIAESCSEFGVLQIITRLVELAVRYFGTGADRISRDRFRFLLLHLVRGAMSCGIVAYTEDLVACVHRLMVGDRSFRNWIEAHAPHHVDPITAFCLNDVAVIRPFVIDEALMRYAYEPMWMLQLLSALTRGERPSEDPLSTTTNLLARTDNFMQQLPAGFSSYNLIREEENSNYISLSEDLPQFESTASARLRLSGRLLGSSSHATDDDSMVIPAGTIGRIVDDNSTPFIAMWEYQHSALDYLVELLSTFMMGSDKVQVSNQQAVSLEVAGETIGLFADLLHSSLREGEGASMAELLNAMNIDTDRRHQDTINIVLAIFDQALLLQCQEPGDTQVLELLINCVRFLQALIHLIPHRVWPWLTRSSLLDTEGKGGNLAGILIGTEVVTGRYRFLIGCIQLFHSLVEDAVGRSVARKVPSKAVTRFNAGPALESGTSDKAMGNVLLAFGKTLATVYESSLGWKFERLEDKVEIHIGICSAFDAIMHYAYGVDDTSELGSKLTSPVAPIAEHITTLYLSTSQRDVPTNPLLTSLLSGATVNKESFSTMSAALWKQQTETALAFSNTLVRVAILTDRPWTHLEEQLFKATPLLSRLFLASDSYTSPILALLETLVRGAVRGTESHDIRVHGDHSKSTSQEPPSLLGHLSSMTAKNFLKVMSHWERPLRMVDVQVQVWKLLSAVVTCKQQWLSLYLLTGSTPRESVRKQANTSNTWSRDEALTYRAIDSITKLDFDNQSIDWSLYASMLEFISSAYNHWAWAMGDFKQHRDFIQKLLAFLKWIPTKRTDPNSAAGALTRSYLNKFAALTCEVLAMHLHTSRQIGDVAPLKDIIPSLGYLQEHALRLPSYNASLHSRLKRNFEKQFNGISLTSLKRTMLDPAPFGRAFFYDVDLANKLFRFSNNWSGPKGTQGHGFAAEVVLANLNLGLVESEVQLLKGWKLLAVELSHVVSKDVSLSRVLIKVVRDCMTTNAESTLPEALFGQLTVLRADLAFVLLQRMVSAKTNTPEARRLLIPVWSAVRAATTDFDTVFASDSVNYYRSLLRTLYLTLQFHLMDESASDEDVFLRSSFRGSVPASKNTLVEPISNQLLEILADAVARGFRSLATQLHSEPGSVSPSDFALLTAILQTILSIPEMTTWHSQAALLFSNSNTLRYATSLFSWSDKLTIQNNGVADPVYGELSLLFILSLSSMQTLAESMAVEGILSQLNSANLMNYYRRSGGMSPFDSPARIFTIWTKGILPLCLNLLRAVGPAIAGEIAAFLNQFPEQLNRASNALNFGKSTTKITLSIASEAHSLALITSILDNDRAQGPRLGIQSNDIPDLDWDRENVKEDIESWLTRRGLLRERIVVVDERDAALFEKPALDDYENMLEKRVVSELTAAGECLGLGKGT
ncbi:uncharacterized protein EI97DRAFT_413750 [Westerdykella ornata]|uniref:Nucleoporin NUP188 n=1 Tax=Westerdykella ornata TaxID=318751 RepID=A0A6A6JRE7_WESOR|nr:uncharacterized protein EI97DRAFT_413750 [Westerdykella ornata]KAF2278844.1 hypothetical protein EI97DRAFT_413750 [Westerdykella ornata]